MNYSKNRLRRRQKEIDSRPVKYRNKIIVIFGELLLIAILIMGITFVGAGVGIMKGIIDSAPDISEIDVIPTGYSTTVLSNNGTPMATLVASGANRKYVTIDEIPMNLQHAFVAIEDERFYKHNGIDIMGIMRAFATGIQNRHFKEGASTITQQLIKNSVLEKTWAAESSMIESFQRKIQEQYLAIELEAQVNNKDWILENYLNTINLGANSLGVQTASERYFGKDVSELTLAECAVIAAITQNPSANNPISHPEKNRKRQQKVLNNMKRLGYITQTEYDEAIAEDVYSNIGRHNSVAEDTNSINSFFTDALIDDVFNDLVNIKGYTETEAYKAIYQGGLTIYSTQDMAIQEICESEVNNVENYEIGTQYSFMLSFDVEEKDGTINRYTHQTMLAHYKEVNNNSDYGINYSSEEAAREAIAEYEEAMCANGGKIVENSESIYITLQPEVALTIIDQSTGEVKAIIGGREEKRSNRNWNRVTDTLRQPGSTFKVIACFAPAIDGAGLTLASTQMDEPFTVGNKTYHNYDKSYRGWTNIREAITDSVNIVTVKTLQEIGIDLGYKYAEQFGITSLKDTDRNLGLALGGLTIGVTNLELTGAYAAIANGGEYIAPTFYSKILDHEGNVLLDSASKERHRVLKEESAWLLTSAMEDVMTSGTGTKAYFGDDMPQAGKSGTTTSNRDSLFAGFSPYYTCVLWGGYDDNSKQTSTSYTKLLWHNVMKRLHENLEPKEFKKPSNIVEKEVCKDTGLLPKKTCPKYTEYFASNNVPEETCSSHSESTESTETEIPNKNPEDDNSSSGGKKNSTTIDEPDNQIEPDVESGETNETGKKKDKKTDTKKDKKKAQEAGGEDDSDDGEPDGDNSGIDDGGEEDDVIDDGDDDDGSGKKSSSDKKTTAEGDPDDE